MSKNVCVYCSLTAYGPGCAFSPTKVHFHPGNANRCCWCNSPAVGPGCPFNPHGKMHVHGIEFNTMVNEIVDKSITLGYLMTVLSTPIDEMKAFKLGIINKQGKKIKIPETAEEKSAYGVLEEYIIGLKQTLGNKLEMLNSATDVRLESFVNLNDYAKICESTLNFKQRFEQAGKEFQNIITDAYQVGISQAVIEKLIIDSILEK